jgi:small GTP-binding protein
MTDISRIRNIAFVGSHHSGKTSLVEAVLAHCGATTRRGSVTDGTTVTDHEPECIAHAQSTTVGFAHCVDASIDMTLIDCPGFIDFFEETKMAVAGVDAAVVVIDADPSRVVQTQALIGYLESRRLPHLFVVNKMDRPGADFAGTVSALQNAYGRHVVVEQLPIGSADAFKGYVDLAEMRARMFDGAGEKDAEIPADLADAANQAHGQLLEAMADFDDHLMEELLEGQEPPLDEIERDLCAECSHDQIVPVLVASGTSGAGDGTVVSVTGRRSDGRRRGTRDRSGSERSGDRPGDQDEHPSAERQALGGARDLRHAQERRDPDRHRQGRREGPLRRALPAAGQEARGRHRGRARQHRRDRAAGNGRDRRHAHLERA